MGVIKGVWVNEWVSAIKVENLEREQSDEHGKDDT